MEDRRFEAACAAGDHWRLRVSRNPSPPGDGLEVYAVLSGGGVEVGKFAPTIKGAIARLRATAAETLARPPEEGDWGLAEADVTGAWARWSAERTCPACGRPAAEPGL
jgi:hypothetical protein